MRLHPYVHFMWPSKVSMMPGSLCFRLREQLKCLKHEGSGREMTDLRRICGGGESDSSSHYMWWR